MLNREESRGGTPQMGPGSSEKPKVNTLLVENFVGLLASFSAAERQAVFKAISAMPDFPRENSPTPTMDWNGLDDRKLSKAELVDYCKRIEWVYKSTESAYIPFARTQQLVAGIYGRGGQPLLEEYTRYLESAYEAGGRAPLRVEKMAMHWEHFWQQYSAK